MGATMQGWTGVGHPAGAPAGDMYLGGCGAPGVGAPEGPAPPSPTLIGLPLVMGKIIRQAWNFHVLPLADCFTKRRKNLLQHFAAKRNGTDSPITSCHPCRVDHSFGVQCQ
uniref:Uncharacterized protein n=1 Tax=Xenopus tropicalis TaxID=8364 RepID=A0A803J488_XENTR